MILRQLMWKNQRNVAIIGTFTQNMHAQVAVQEAVRVMTVR